MPAQPFPRDPGPDNEKYAAEPYLAPVRLIASKPPVSARSEAVLALRQRLLQSAQRAPNHAVVSTGFATLDKLLPERGLPSGAIIEWISDVPGVSTMSLAVKCALPLLQRPGAFAVPDPQRQFNPQAAAALGMPLSRLLLIRPEDISGNVRAGLLSGPPSHLLRRDMLWALEQLARCSGVRVVLCWLDGISSTALRRLQLAVERSGVTVFLVRPAAAIKQSSWADLRLHVRYAAGTVTVKLLRSRHTVLHHGCARFGIDDETSEVFEIPELAGPATATVADA